jgi:hypothetical protein
VNDPSDKNNFDFEMLRRYGAKWAVLAAMTADMTKKGIEVPHAVFEALKAARGKIESGCFSPCEVGCDLSPVEGQLFSQGYLLEQKHFQQWSDLLGEAMQGKLDYQRIMGIPAFDPVKNDCRFLGCACFSEEKGARNRY